MLNYLVVVVFCFFFASITIFDSPLCQHAWKNNTTIKLCGGIGNRALQFVGIWYNFGINEICTKLQNILGNNWNYVKEVR